jgi:predicted GNAT family N-acyltransferase
MKQFDQALPLLKQALDILHGVLPPGHPNILSAQRSIENLRRVMGAESTGNSWLRRGIQKLNVLKKFNF